MIVNVIIREEDPMNTLILRTLFLGAVVTAVPGVDPLTHADEAFSSDGSSTEQYPLAIEDNSYFIEEAYNQETRVVQHISNFAYFRSPVRSLGYSFTQEWPVHSQRHQLSYTIPYMTQGDGLGNGFGDVMLNYRYQLSGHDAAVTMAPRVSLLFASGDEEKGLGSGANGLQFNFPMSKRLSAGLVVHANAGATVLVSAKGETSAGGEIKENLWTYNLGGSVIGLLTPSFNVMLEAVSLFSDDFNEQGLVKRSTETIFSPGFRYAISRGSLQIVPGFALPVSITSEATRVGAFFYLSLEHPF